MSDRRKNQGNRGKFARPVADYVSRLLNPVIEQRAGMTMDLIATWDEIAGQDYCDHCRPEKLNWPRQYDDDDPFQPATLVIACEPSHALFLQHDSTGLVQRVNSYFGFSAIDRVKIVQKPITSLTKGGRGVLPQIRPSKARELQNVLKDVEDEKLRTSLEKLGKAVFSKRS